MKLIGDSRFFGILVRKYARAPSIALCRVPELELLSTIRLEHPILDHCCGDGYVASIAFPGTYLDAGVDISDSQLKKAQQLGTYREVKWGDAGASVPFADSSFSTVINNSGIEHIANLERALSEIARVMRPGGTLYINVLNSRFFDWWPLAASAADRYRRLQPFFHAFSEADWTSILRRSGFNDVGFTDYLPQPASRLLAALDYRFSMFYFRRRVDPLLLLHLLSPTSLLVRRCRKLLGGIQWDAEVGAGAGFLISTRRSAK